MKKIIVLLALSVIAAHLTFGQEYTRVIELQNRRMNGPDVTSIQTRLVALGFSEIGEVDGYYGPVTEGVVKKIQLFLGFESTGKITRAVVDIVDDLSEELMGEITRDLSADTLFILIKAKE
jgi:peptidoglycan hydrolase-like protein with peptidoglycan-binding domain